MNPFDAHRHALSVNRRTFLTQSAYGLGGLALALMSERRAAAGASGSTGAPSRLPPGWSGALARRTCRSRRSA